MIHPGLKTTIEKASAYVQKTWPLYSFVTSNPLSGYEQQSFFKAAGQAKKILNARVYPEVSFYREALQNGEINSSTLQQMLLENDLDATPKHYLELLERSEAQVVENTTHNLDRLTVKWLSAFMDEGLAEWSMPGKEKGFYEAWRALAIYDDELSELRNNELPKTASEALIQFLGDLDEEEQMKLIIAHLAALPGWTGYIKHRMEAGASWQRYAPITLEDYLAVRVCIAHALKTPVVPADPEKDTPSGLDKVKYVFLKAWERTWQTEMVRSLSENTAGRKNSTQEVPDAQLVFCIDTRSEAIRRHVEASGKYETFGYAGFFGIAMDYADPKTGLSRKSCPPIVGSAYEVKEHHAEDHAHEYERYRKQNEMSSFFTYFQKRMKNMLPSTFGYVEGSGVSYGLALLGRTLFPGASYRTLKKQENGHERFCEPEISKTDHAHNLQDGIPLAERVAIVKSAFDLMGWKRFAPLVIFTGHGSHTSNNPFGSSLDCGACAASPGRHNARMLAKLANMKEVRKALEEDHGIHIPENTWFMGAEHNTTTDRIELFEKDLPATHKHLLDQVKTDLEKARHTATAQRLEMENGSARAAEDKAGNWAETRPEWGLAKNAGFIIAPRARTKDIDLDGRCFLHSYQWETDTEGKALEGIMQGPMVVTQWINNHYYFSTVDPEQFGSGSKITQNITGMFGVVQGNGGDLKSGLPLQSVRLSDQEMYHQPLRLSVIIEAPKERVASILERNTQLKNLLDNEWIYLLVTDPTREYTAFRYTGNLNWHPEEKSIEVRTPAKRSVSTETVSV